MPYHLATPAVNPILSDSKPLSMPAIAPGLSPGQGLFRRQKLKQDCTGLPGVRFSAAAAHYLPQKPAAQAFFTSAEAGHLGWVFFQHLRNQLP